MSDKDLMRVDFDGWLVQQIFERFPPHYLPWTGFITLECLAIAKDLLRSHWYLDSVHWSVVGTLNGGVVKKADLAG